jgi:hypothetical protein
MKFDFALKTFASRDFLREEKWVIISSPLFFVNKMKTIFKKRRDWLDD